MVWIIETEIGDCDLVTELPLKPPIISRLVQGGLEVQFLKTMAPGSFCLTVIFDAIGNRGSRFIDDMSSSKY